MFFQSHGFSPSSEIEIFENFKTEGTTLIPEQKLDAQAKEGKEVEGKSILERFGANISISRKGSRVATKVKEEPADEGTESDENESSKTPARLQKDELLERLNSIGGISFAPKSKSTTNGGSEKEESRSNSGISIASKLKPIDISQLTQLKKVKENDADDANKKILDKQKILERLSGLGGISIASKVQNKAPQEAVEEEDDEDDDYEDEDDVNDDKEAAESVKPTSENNQSAEVRPDAKSIIESIPGLSISRAVKPRPEARNESQDSNDSSDSRHSASEQPSAKQSESSDQSANSANDGESEKVETRKQVRVKNTRKEGENRKQEGSSSSDELESSFEAEKEEGDTRESGIDILERLTDSLNNTVGLDKSQEPNGNTLIYLNSKMNIY